MSGLNESRPLTRLCTWGTLAACTAFALLPILWGISTALKESGAAEVFPPQWVPRPPTLENFRQVLLGSSLARYLWNSAVVAVVTILATLAVAVHAGYAAARFRFGGKQALLFLILATAMIPGICILVPVYLLVTGLRLHNTYLALVIVYTAWQVPTAVWIMRGFFESIHPELEEAALMDGCSRLRAFYWIILPLTQPGMAAVGILVFVYVWNDFLIAYVLTISDEMRLIQSGLYLYVTAFGVEWSKLMAASVLALLPPAVTFLFLQSRFIQGLTKGAIK
ncbi:MAG TPA: carbohydrate ABC transporter permease [Candidatus Sulfotelmatobacter sp.]|nr:carbohydrate ABC transporter permease [Candidatus Sulfotelmatobacter sp.]